MEFLEPIRADEMVEGRASTQNLGNTSVTTRIELWGVGADTSDASLRSVITLVHVHVDLETGKSIPIPDDARRALQS